ncbi:oligosaccharide repeat unit polymerase [Nocardioides yefusunii]|uniref:Oligosaccharide repeat unit polymerase n=1 Tax=Nocardioides yefusunii TaxID=2500546 RepID=A0ABW1QTS5_9ACTN|nr:oligosaccharide repeat unit polymerase [Nocardioides yefusunii]
MIDVREIAAADEHTGKSNAAASSTSAMFTLVAAAFLVLISFMAIPGGLRHALEINVPLGVSLGLVGLQSAALILINGRKFRFSIGLVHGIFCFIFLYLAPLAQLKSGKFPWVPRGGFSPEVMLDASLVVNLWLVTWISASLFWLSRIPSEAPGDGFSRRALAPASGGRVAVLAVLSFVALGYLVSRLGVDGLLLRSQANEGRSNLSGSSSLQLLISYCARAVPVAFFVAALTRVRESRNASTVATAIIALALSIALNFPTATPRFWAAAIVLGLAIHMGFFKRHWTLMYALSFGTFMLFPLLGSLRNSRSLADSGNANTSALSDIQAELSKGDYDSFSMVSNSVVFVHHYGADGGGQLISSLLGFVPRSLWPGKSVGTGSYVAEPLNLSYDNISFPLMSEFHLNFGWIGVVLGALFVSWLCTKVDAAYWRSNSPAIGFVYPFAIGFVMFISRGDLMSSFTFSLGGCVTVLLLVRLGVVRERPLK